MSSKRSKKAAICIAKVPAGSIAELSSVKIRPNDTLAKFLSLAAGTEWELRSFELHADSAHWGDPLYTSLKLNLRPLSTVTAELTPSSSSTGAKRAG